MLQASRVLRLYIHVPPDGERERCAKTCGRRSRLGVCSFLSALFYANEHLLPRKRMTDVAILRQFENEFPDYPAVREILTGKRTIGYYRQLYNAGRLTQRQKPERPSRRYNHAGQVVNPRNGNLPKSEADRERLERKYGYSFTE